MIMTGERGHENKPKTANESNISRSNRLAVYGFPPSPPPLRGVKNGLGSVVFLSRGFLQFRQKTSALVIHRMCCDSPPCVKSQPRWAPFWCFLFFFLAQGHESRVLGIVSRSWSRRALDLVLLPGRRRSPRRRRRRRSF
jgi:hypothetical protein